MVFLNPGFEIAISKSLFRNAHAETRQAHRNGVSQANFQIIKLQEQRMGRPRDVNYEKVVEAASQLMHRGTQPTPTLIRNEIGGSFFVVKELFDKWGKTRPANAELERIAPEVSVALIREFHRIAAACEARHSEASSISQENYANLNKEHQELLADQALAADSGIRLQSELDRAMALADARAADLARLRMELEREHAEKSALEVAHAQTVERGMVTEEALERLHAAISTEKVQHLETCRRMQQEEISNAGLLGRQIELEERVKDLQHDKDVLTREADTARRGADAAQARGTELNQELLVTRELLHFSEMRISRQNWLRPATFSTARVGPSGKLGLKRSMVNRKAVGWRKLRPPPSSKWKGGA